MPIIVESYINAYNTAFNQATSSFNLNYQEALYNHHYFSSSDVNNNFVPGTFGDAEEYDSSIGKSFRIEPLIDNSNKVLLGGPRAYVASACSSLSSIIM